jgi:hypothetical protein
MDTAIKDGDFKLNEQGKPYLINAMDETLQRCRILLTVKQGSFAYNRALGGNLYLLNRDDENLQGNALLLVREALLPVKQVTVDSVIAKAVDNGILLEISITAYGENAYMEVTV